MSKERVLLEGLHPFNLWKSGIYLQVVTVKITLQSGTQGCYEIPPPLPKETTVVEFILKSDKIMKSKTNGRNLKGTNLVCPK